MFPLVIITDPDVPYAVLQATHSETLYRGWLTHNNTGASLTAKETATLEDPRLSPGFRVHRRHQLPYNLNCVINWIDTDLNSPELGVCYSALYPPKDGHGPHWFRPLHTHDGQGWLDPGPDGNSRFIQP